MNSAGLVSKNPANKTTGKHIHNYSSFDDSLSYTKSASYRFGEYGVSFEMDGVERDVIHLNSLDKVDSLSLKAPFKNSIRKIKESFKVPNMAILPLNWDRIYAQPANGDDVPKDANCVLFDFPYRVTTWWDTMFQSVINNIPGSTASQSDLNAWVTAFLRVMILGEFFFSEGSLLNQMGYKSNAFFKIARFNSYDAFFDTAMRMVCQEFESFVVDFPVGSGVREGIYFGTPASLTPNLDTTGYSSFRSLLCELRENPLGYIYSSTLVYGSTLSSVLGFLATLTQGSNIFSSMPTYLIPQNTEDPDDVTSLNSRTLNLTRILSYQLVCAHFYSNSAVDFIYSAELYRQYIFQLGFDDPNTPQMTHPNFTWNGIKCPYDYLSGRMIDSALYMNYGHTTLVPLSYAVLSANGGTSASHSRLAVAAAIFGFRRSLRFSDYFVSARPRPLAPINTDVAVSSSNTVSVIDITRNIQAQRFGNAVMRSRAKIEEYVESLFGKKPDVDFHNPLFLSREVETIFGEEVQNTGDAQVLVANSRTALLSSNLGRYTFTFNNDDMHPCTYLQIISFDIKRSYTRSVDRQFLHVDRFDMFNPDFQYIGDQPVYGVELGLRPLSGGSVPAVFGYQNRDMEYKQRFDVACGAFIHNLPGWILTDDDPNRTPSVSIDPDFIRSYQTELDQFFLALSGYSLATYSHFLIRSVNNVSAKRAMAVDPQILA